MNCPTGSLLAAFTLSALCLGTVGCSSNHYGTTPVAAGPCDQNAALFATGAAYEIKTTATTTEGLSGGTVVVTQFNNTSDYKVVGNKTFAGIQTVDTNLAETSTAVLTNPDGTTLGFSESVVADTYQTLTDTSLSTYGISQVGTVVSPSLGDPQTTSLQESISPARTVPAEPVLGTDYSPQTVVVTSLSSVNGGTPAKSVDNVTVTRTYSTESVTVPAGTFQACKESDTNSGDNVTFNLTSTGKISIWTVGTGPCRGMLLKQTSATTGSTSPNLSTVEQATALNLNGQACTN